jgi:hypothetical protein
MSTEFINFESIEFELDGLKPILYRVGSDLEMGLSGTPEVLDRLNDWMESLDKIGLVLNTHLTPGSKEPINPVKKRCLQKHLLLSNYWFDIYFRCLRIGGA